MDREPALTPRLEDAAGRRFRGRPREVLAGHNPYVAEHVAFGPEVVPAEEAPRYAGDWAACFGRAAPLHLEIGSGNGFYLAGMAAAHPEASWLGLEIRYKRVMLAAYKLRALGLANARVLRWDAYLVDQLFPDGSLAGLHVNHPDPWPKERQARRRLIGPAFVASAARLLAPGGELRLRSDFAPHLEALLAAVRQAPFDVLGVRRVLHVEGAPWPDDVRTNYQRKSEEAGRPVGAVWLRRR